MHYLSGNDRDMWHHAADLTAEKMAEKPDEYADEDGVSLAKLNAVSIGGPALVVTRAELSPYDANSLLGQVIRAELANWVPDASQRRELPPRWTSKGSTSRNSGPRRTASRTGCTGSTCRARAAGTPAAAVLPPYSVADAAGCSGPRSAASGRAPADSRGRGSSASGAVTS